MTSQKSISPSFLADSQPAAKDDFSHEVDEWYSQFYGSLHNFIVHYFTTAYQDDFHPDNFQYNYQIYKDDFSFVMTPCPDAAHPLEDLQAVAENFLEDLSKIAAAYQLDNIDTITEHSDTTHRYGFSSRDMGQLINLFERCIKKYNITTLDNFGIGHFSPASPKDIPSAILSFQERAGIENETIADPTCNRVDYCPPIPLDRDLAYVTFCRANYKPNLIPDSLNHVRLLYSRIKGHPISDEGYGLLLCH